MKKINKLNSVAIMVIMWIFINESPQEKKFEEGVKATNSGFKPEDYPEACNTLVEHNMLTSDLVLTSFGKAFCFSRMAKGVNFKNLFTKNKGKFVFRGLIEAIYSLLEKTNSGEFDIYEGSSYAKELQNAYTALANITIRPYTKVDGEVIHEISDVVPVATEEAEETKA